MGRSRGVQEERTEHTQLFSRTLAGFRLTGRQRVHFSTFDGKLNFNVLEMVFKTFHTVQGLSRTPLLFIPRYLTNVCFENILRKYKISRIGNLKIPKPRFTNRCLVHMGSSSGNALGRCEGRTLRGLLKSLLFEQVGAPKLLNISAAGAVDQEFLI